MWRNCQTKLIIGTSSNSHLKVEIDSSGSHCGCDRCSDVIFNAIALFMKNISFQVIPFQSERSAYNK